MQFQFLYNPISITILTESYYQSSNMILGVERKNKTGLIFQHSSHVPEDYCKQMYGAIHFIIKIVIKRNHQIMPTQQTIILSYNSSKL